MLLPPPIPTLFPYTTLFRSRATSRTSIAVLLLIAADNNFPNIPCSSGGNVRKIIICGDRKSTRLNSSHVAISYAVFCLKKKKDSVTGNRKTVSEDYDHNVLV